MLTVPCEQPGDDSPWQLTMLEDVYARILVEVCAGLSRRHEARYDPVTIYS